NPIPAEDAMDKAVIDAAIDLALKEAGEAGIKGKEVSPFLLGRVLELTGGESLESNIKLVLDRGCPKRSGQPLEHLAQLLLIEAELALHAHACLLGIAQ
ncbi:MAG: pseudouridine-5'-phosphate glycosidase, partial [Chloroflexi bacterium]|nr:pseudouridine-5'-phosphate glycosidase [Chloroflexota bacterium]